MLDYLKLLGYEMSEEEEGYYNGTHAIYSQREPAVEEESA